MMPQIEMNALSSVARQLPEISKQLRALVKLKAMELRLKLGAESSQYANEAELDAVLADAK